MEAWNQYPAAMQLAEGGTGDTFRLLIPPADTEMIDYPLRARREFDLSFHVGRMV